jgi:hypothetical protein
MLKLWSGFTSGSTPPLYFSVTVGTSTLALINGAMTCRQYLNYWIAQNPDFTRSIIGPQCQNACFAKETLQHLVLMATLRHTGLDREYTYVPLRPQIVKDNPMLTKKGPDALLVPSYYQRNFSRNLNIIVSFQHKTRHPQDGNNNLLLEQIANQYCTKADLIQVALDRPGDYHRAQALPLPPKI